MDRPWLVPCAVIAVVVICACIGVALIGVLGGAIYLSYQVTPTGLAILSPEPGSTATQTPVVIRPTQLSETPVALPEPLPTGTPTPQPTATAVAAGPEDTLLALQAAEVPTSDPIELAQRLLGMERFPRTLAAPSEA